jgi:hypothetical protein
MTTIEISKFVIYDVMRELTGRKGFDDWWDNIDDDIQKEIFDKLETQVAERLRSFMKGEQ